MPIRLQVSERFERSSWVGRYWLTRCEGFRVTGATEGTVAEVLADRDPHTPAALVVHGRWRRRRRTLPVGAVSAVVPAERLIVVAGDRPPRAAPRRSSAKAARAARAVGTGVARRGPGAARLAGVAGREALRLAGAVIAVLAFLAASVIAVLVRVTAALWAGAVAEGRRRRARATRAQHARRRQRQSAA